MTSTERVIKIIPLLHKAFPEPKTMLSYTQPFELLAATILAAQCTDARVNMITPGLFKKYKTLNDFANAKQPELEKEIHSTGFFRNKAKNIIGAAKMILSDFGGKVPDTMAQLITLPGVARKTANILLSSYFRKPEGIAVDTHVLRLSQRMGLSKHDDPVHVEQDLMEILPKKEWLDFNFLMVNHGRTTCQARKPDCPNCVLARLCPKIGI